MKLQSFNRGPLFAEAKKSSFVDERGRLVEITESKSLCRPDPMEYWKRLGSKSVMLTRHQYEGLLAQCTE